MAIPDAASLRADIARYRTTPRARPAEIEPVGPGEESVWDFPRPPEVQPVSAPIAVRYAGAVIAHSERGLRVVETAGAPVYFFPPSDVDQSALRLVEDVWTLCEWKGVAVYYDLEIGARRSDRAAFAYPEPLRDLGQGYERIAGWFAFYPHRVDVASIDGAPVDAQPGEYYAGWVTSKLRGPLKGVEGSAGW